MPSSGDSIIADTVLVLSAWGRVDVSKNTYPPFSFSTEVSVLKYFNLKGLSVKFHVNTVIWRFWFESPSILTLDPHFTHTCTFIKFIKLYFFVWSIMVSETIFGGILVKDQNMSVFLNKQDVLRSSYFLNKQDVYRSSYFLNKQDVLRSSFFP